MTILYRKNAGGIGSWKIYNTGNIIRISHCTKLGDTEVHHEEIVERGLASRTLEQQIDSRIKSRISRMLDKGYKFTYEEAENSSTNQLGLLRPMLAQSYGKALYTHLDGAVLQKKLDGHRCLITKQDGQLIAYSRQGKIIDSIKHILKELQDKIPEGVTIDGELYHHGTALQTIASWIKREQENTAKLFFAAYDIISDEIYSSRICELQDILGPKTEGSKIILLPVVPYINDDKMYEELARVRALGFEGLMLRLNNSGYQDGKRSASLLKVKQFHDDEFECIDIEPSRDGWGICILKTHDGKIFKTSAPGNMHEKLLQLQNKELYIGKKLTVEYSQLTDDGIPFHCSAIRWREDV